MKGFFARNWEEPAYLGPLVLIRVFCGYYFLSAAITKLALGLVKEPAYSGMFQKALATHTSPWYKSFITSVVIPNIGFFASVQMVGEILLGLALVLGLLTRLAALVGVFALLNYWYAVGGAFPMVPQVNKLMGFALVAVFLTAAGRSFGVDRWLHQKFPRNPLF